MSVIYAPEDRPLEIRMLLAPAALVLVLFGFLGRLWYLQVSLADELRERADTTGQINVEKLAPRGKIVDRTGAILGGVQQMVVVTAKPKLALKNPEVVAKVAAMLGIETTALTKAIRDVDYAGEIAVPVYVGADVVTASKIAEMSDELPGFGVESQAMRTYARPTEVGHIMGYVRTPRKVDVERLEAQGVRPAQYVGIIGLERQYETILMGKPGTEKVAVDARRRRTRSLGADEPVPGATAILSLDAKFQTLANELLRGRRGSVAALDPRNGEVLCLASSPTYDASLFLKGISKTAYSQLRDDPAKPMFFRATGASYPPGSTFKIVTTIASWLTNKASLTSTTFCPGYLKVGNRKIKCLGTHGSIAYDLAFTKSCNTYFGNLAMEVGREGLLEACRQIGLGKPTGLDLPGESAGTVPTPEWWAKHRERRWSLGDTANFGIGQGELATTPLQMASVVALVANRGISYKPHLLKATLGPEEGAKQVPFVPEILGKVEARDDQWQTLSQAMFHVIEYGTAKSAQIAGVDWGGKTGSAENHQDNETHSWFVGMGPIRDPKIVICVMVENAGHGGEVAAPIAARLVKYWLTERGKKPNVSVQSAASREETSPNQALSEMLIESP